MNNGIAGPVEKWRRDSKIGCHQQQECPRFEHREAWGSRFVVMPTSAGQPPRLPPPFVIFERACADAPWLAAYQTPCGCPTLVAFCATGWGFLTSLRGLVKSEFRQGRAEAWAPRGGATTLMHRWCFFAISAALPRRPLRQAPDLRVTQPGSRLGMAEIYHRAGGRGCDE
jgi:hypothetical protein